MQSVRSQRIFFLIAVLIVAGLIAWWWQSQRSSTMTNRITVYYTKLDGKSEIPWTVSMRPPAPGESSAEHLHNTVLYAATQVLAGPPATTAAIRFPPGTHVLSANVTGSTVTLDLSGEAARQSGDLAENGAFKSLVWTMTALPGINAVAVRVAGQQLTTLPGGHLELDEPLRRSDW